MPRYARVMVDDSGGKAFDYELPEAVAHLLARHVDPAQDREADPFQRRRDILGIIAGIGELRELAIRGVADDKRNPPVRGRPAGRRGQKEESADNQRQEGAHAPRELGIPSSLPLNLPRRQSERRAPEVRLSL